MVGSSDFNNGGSALNWSKNRIVNNSWGLKRFLKVGIGSLIAGSAALMFNVASAIVTFITAPLKSLGTSVGNLVSSLIGGPTTILSKSASTGATGISNSFTGFLGPLAWPVGVGSILLGLLIVDQYLQRRSTSDLLPGSFSDIRTPGWLEDIGMPSIGAPEDSNGDTEG